MKAYRSTFPARIHVKSQEDKPDTDCPRDPDGLIADSVVEEAAAQVAMQAIEDNTEVTLVAENGSKPKSLAAVREEARQFMVKTMQAGARVEVREFEVSE